MQTLKVKNGKYTNLQMLNMLDGGAAVYSAVFTMRDGYTEMRVLTVKNNKVLAWQS
jgi:hypothetical protein